MAVVRLSLFPASLQDRTASKSLGWGEMGMGWQAGRPAAGRPVAGRPRAEPKAERVVTWQNLNNRRPGGRRKTSTIAGREAGAEPQQHRPIGRCKWGGAGGVVAHPAQLEAGRSEAGWPEAGQD